MPSSALGNVTETTASMSSSTSSAAPWPHRSTTALPCERINVATGWNSTPSATSRSYAIRRFVSSRADPGKMVGVTNSTSTPREARAYATPKPCQSPNSSKTTTRDPRPFVSSNASSAPYTAISPGKLAGAMAEPVATTTASGPYEPAISGNASMPNLTVTPADSHWPPSQSTTWASSLRSEEHTSELQSRQYLVCRLLLE